MKTLKTMFAKIAFILLTLVLSSCSSNDDSTNSEQSNYYLTAKVDGVNFSIDIVTVSTLADETDFYVISGVGENTSIGLTLESPISVGTFTTGVAEIVALTYQTNSPFVVFGASQDVGSGTITITENNANYIKGTFSFTGINQLDNSTKEISEGAFKAVKL
ncbi:DUF6252 family protein [Psychroserpens jangbogonensis]|uniref:DUF6252 family protein n=1 Tax=Psychroserpens jangbogonensis TaxID=1484460 RepID=UPI00053E3885|nr:DUF6252 family protein [Psychroserpens jangbogonensis]